MAITDQERIDFAARREHWRQTYQKPGAQRPRSTARGVHHVALICSDVERTIQFYDGLLGFPVVEIIENRDYKGSTHLFFDLGHDNLLGFFDFPGLGLQPGGESIGSVQHIAISIDSDQFEAAKQRLAAAGVPYVGPDRGIIDSIYFKDPDGIQIELIREPLMVQDGHRLGGD
jgi:glyoxylase I family protein